MEILLLKFSTKNISHGLNLNRGSYSLNSASGNVNYRSKSTNMNKKIYVEKKIKNYKIREKGAFRKPSFIEYLISCFFCLCSSSSSLLFSFKSSFSFSVFSSIFFSTSFFFKVISFFFFSSMLNFCRVPIREPKRRRLRAST